ncbi:hypothetical protein BOTBODRAFT_32635 [Botryobasidium botryosum FD-172 SS1]|uniref:Uncharacterized protein n=1 Tax=Botryobasidium botryosum (strain FD-172 SS1) TaxID=930990 RepID=A0A067MFE4_BOTB1|nr:hypothetical protein BOTBODRAFT_32635 [Botryobasidium botryosum FD-172 SS1]
MHFPFTIALLLTATSAFAAAIPRDALPADASVIRSEQSDAVVDSFRDWKKRVEIPHEDTWRPWKREGDSARV